LGQPVDLLAQGQQLATCFSEGVNELRVALGQLADALGCLGQSLLQQADVSRGLRQLAAQQRDLVLEEPDLRCQLI
jgi:hypothetical protein